ncbi:hypothetical protein FQN49_004590 [Arthroderma sp. PD_2]|nr:hypothetical protein FQN49_004590 [Arthroderma sp. PD_2]
MPHHVYVLWRGTDSAPGNHNGETYRNILTMPDRETADYFFRGIQEHLPFTVGGNKIKSVERLSPQMWQFFGDGADQVRTVVRCLNEGAADAKDKPYLKEAAGKIFHMWLNDTGGRDMPTFVGLETAGFVDRVDGAYCYIRSRLEPYRYWYVDDTDTSAVTLDKEEKTKFKITVVDNKIKGAVIVASDKIRLTPVHKEEHEVTVDKNTGYMSLARWSHHYTFKFGAFFGGIESNLATLNNRHARGPRLLGSNDEATNAQLGEFWDLLA